ncbi:hypothetical protein DXG01_000090 [Tephrocybe rancida]|nr:hypothetical protein DXG01_000090 [Tephrocybe rancida]
MPFLSLVVWPSAPLTERLVCNALNALDVPTAIVTSVPQPSSDVDLVQWASYDAIDHELTHHGRENVLASSYIFRKALIRKHFLSRCLNAYTTKHPSSPLKAAVPKTYEIEISFADELDEMWADDLWDLGESLELSQSWWILKPGMSDRGMGIRLFNSKDSLQQIFEEFELSDDEEEEGAGDASGTAVVTSQLRHFVIQEYLPNPLLLDPSEVPINGLSKPTELQGRKTHNGCQILSSHGREAPGTFTAEDLAEIIRQMAEILAETFTAALENPVHFQPLPNAFELYGIDFLVAHSLTLGEPKLQVKLLEINAEPAIELTGPRLTWILEDLFISMGKATPTRKRSKWEGGEDDDDDSAPNIRIPPLKRRAKQRPSTKPSDPPTNPVIQPNTSVRPSHSIYVPPRTRHPPILPARSVYSYERLNQIEEGSYGVVFRARDKQTGDIVALKKLKLDDEKNGFPITALREVFSLMTCRHENVVGVREVVVGDTLTQVFVVMDFIEHDLKSLLTIMPSPFLQSETKTLMLQLLSAVGHCHSNWILHRDLKTSNLLMNNRGRIKVADFGLARRYGDPVGVGGMTQLVVTLWYRAPEILLGATTYSTAIDMWSVGCIFAELLLKEPLFQAKGEIELISMIFKLLGPPTHDSWPGYFSLPMAKTLTLPSPQPHQFRQKFQYMTTAGIDLLMSLLTYDPERRITAEEALQHPYFTESPLPKHPDLFGSFPSAAAGEKRRKPFDSPSAPARAADYKLLMDFEVP